MTEMTARDMALDALTTHRHGAGKEPCQWCRSYYGDIFDKIVESGALDALAAEKASALAAREPEVLTECPKSKFPDGTRCGDYGFHAVNCPERSHDI